MYRRAYTSNHTEYTKLHCDVDCNILKAIEKLQRDFRERVTQIRLSFRTVSVAAIKELLFQELPAGEVKVQVGVLLNNNFTAIMSSHSIDHLFTYLSNIQAWDFLHPQLLEYLVQELGNDDAKRSMEGYKSCLVEFRATTKMRQLSGWFGRITETSTFQKIVLSLGDDWEEKFYEDFEELRVSLLRQEVFFQSSLHLCGVLTGSLFVALVIPKSVDVVQMLGEHQLLKFLMDNGISRVYAAQVCLIQDNTPKPLHHHNIVTIDPAPEVQATTTSVDMTPFSKVPLDRQPRQCRRRSHQRSVPSDTGASISEHKFKSFEGQQPLSTQQSENISWEPSSIEDSFAPDNDNNYYDIPKDESESQSYPIQESSSSPTDNVYSYI